MMKKILLFAFLLMIPLVSAQSATDTAKELLPNVDFNSFGTVISIFILVVIVLAGLGVGAYILVRELKFNRKVSIWEDVEGHDDLESVGKDKAMLVKVGRGGTELLYLKKRKVYRGSYGKRVGKKQYFFVIGKDGYWYNATLGSLEGGLNKIGIKPTNVNMRYQNESLMELIKDRYDKKGWWEQYGQLTMNIVFFMLVAVMFWLYFAAFKETAPAIQAASESLAQAGESIRSAVAGLDQLGGSGVRPVS